MSKKDDVAYSLQTLCHPASEFLADGQRLTLFIKRGNEAASEILRLRAENEKLRAALKPFADCEVWEGYKGYERFVAGMFHIHNKGMGSLNISPIRAARAAYLGEKDD